MGGVGRMCSFGESVSMTPLQLGAIVSAIANGGILFYLQHPTTTDEIATLQPKVKRTLDIAALLPEMKDGMFAATVYGTARPAQGKLYGVSGDGQDGDVLQQRDTIWLVRVLRGYAERANRDGDLPRRRAPDVWA